MRGHQVSLIAGSLNYATGAVPRELAGKFVTRRDENGIDTWRCFVPRTYNRSFLGRIWSFFGFMVSASVAIARSPRPDVVIATSPPLTSGILGWLASVRHRRPWVFEIRDLWPESAITTGVIARGGLLAKVLTRMERFSCSRASMINVLTPAFRDDIVARGLAAPDKIAFVPNGADLDLMAPAARDTDFRKAHGWGNKFVALYAGAHGKANALMQLVSAAEHLANRPDILIATVGDGPERVACTEAAAMKGLRNIEFLGPVPKEQMAEVINSADAGLAVLQNNPTFKTVYPNKAFDYMSCARPTVLAIDGVARDLVCEQAKGGIFVEPENGLEIAQAITRLADAPGLADELGRSGRDWVVQNASREGLADRYLECLDRLVNCEKVTVQGAAT